MAEKLLPGQSGRYDVFSPKGKLLWWNALVRRFSKTKSLEVKSNLSGESSIVSIGKVKLTKRVG